ncbi:MAG TPA: fluoride efflux transporter CrcB [Solirubrobacteraceae bacterium]|nr:fluoride efflux transporter CrcB [Solirubrobacteraceae bacterium]
MSGWAWAAVAAVGGFGAVVRFLIDGLIGERLATAEFPWGTLAVNLSGSALLGALAGAAVRGEVALLAGTAAIGSYTTLSTWALESHRLAEDDRLGLAAINVFGSLVAGFASVAAGHAIGRLL